MRLTDYIDNAIYAIYAIRTIYAIHASCAVCILYSTYSRDSIWFYTCCIKCAIYASYTTYTIHTICALYNVHDMHYHSPPHTTGGGGIPGEGPANTLPYIHASSMNDPGSRFARPSPRNGIPRPYAVDWLKDSGVLFPGRGRARFLQIEWPGVQAHGLCWVWNSHTAPRKDPYTHWFCCNTMYILNITESQVTSIDAFSLWPQKNKVTETFPFHKKPVCNSALFENMCVKVPVSNHREKTLDIFSTGAWPWIAYSAVTWFTLPGHRLV